VVRSRNTQLDSDPDPWFLDQDHDADQRIFNRLFGIGFTYFAVLLAASLPRSGCH